MNFIKKIKSSAFDFRGLLPFFCEFVKKKQTNKLYIFSFIPHLNL